MRITESEKEALLVLAERAIREKISPGQLLHAREPELTENLNCKCGAFVSVYIEGELRGCIGTFSEEEPLVRTVERESLIKKSIQELCEALDPEQFWRIHRSTIINVSRISVVTRSFAGRYLVKLKDLPETLTVSRTYAHLFKQM